MLSVKDAQKKIWQDLKKTCLEWVSLNDAPGRILADNLKAMRNQPPFRASAMDGYAVRTSDVLAGGALKLVGQVQAGRPSTQSISQGETARIFTGARVPDGADAILIQENARRDGDQVWPEEPVETGLFIRPEGLDFRKDEQVIQSGRRLDGRSLALAASMGHLYLPVLRRPGVRLIATGDELKWPGSDLAPGEIISSNNLCLKSMAQSWGAAVSDGGIVQDNLDELVAELTQSSVFSDLVITSGGASVGEFDLVQKAAGLSGFELNFWKIRMRPGKPLIFGSLRGVPFLGLPGNPVSASVCAIMFVRGAIFTMLGLKPDIPYRKAILAEPMPENGEREFYARGVYADEEHRQVIAANNQETSMFATFANADVLIKRDPCAGAGSVGDEVKVIDLESVL